MWLHLDYLTFLNQFLYSIKYEVYDNAIMLPIKILNYPNLFKFCSIIHFVSAGIGFDVTENLTSNQMLLKGERQRFRIARRLSWGNHKRQSYFFKL